LGLRCGLPSLRIPRDHHVARLRQQRLGLTG
jgi:hypothetical protein